MMKDIPLPPTNPTHANGGRCAGRNPSPVLSGIQLYGLPGSSRRSSKDPYSPFHPAGAVVSPMPVASSASKASLRATGGLVSVRCQGSPPTPHSVAVLRGGWSFLRPCGPAAAHRLTDQDHTHTTTL